MRRNSPCWKRCGPRIETLKDQRLRALAEAENIRRRAEKERKDAEAYAVTKFARDMVGIADNFARALAAVPADGARRRRSAMKAVLDGVEATDRQLIQTLERYGVKQVDTDGKFDPNLHQAIAEVPGDGKPARQHRGCDADRLHDRRPAAAPRHGDGGAARSRERSDTTRKSERMADLKIVVAGASGRMGRTLVREIAQGAGVTLCGALEAEGHPDLGMDAGTLAGMQPNGIQLTADPLPLLASAQAVMDFTRPMVSTMLAELAAQARIVHVIGTTGFSPADDKRVAAAASHAVIMKSGNMSMGVNMLAAMVAQAAKALPNYDIEMLEMHHRMKVDAPSGTALLLGEAAAKARGIALDKHWVKSRDGHNLGPREDGSIGFATLRGGTVVGEHQVILAGPGERITLSHIAEDRSIFAHGALKAARGAMARSRACTA